MKSARDMTDAELLAATGFPPFDDDPPVLPRARVTQARWRELCDEHQRRACAELG